MTKFFSTGHSYLSRFIGDYDSTIVWTVEKRTAKTVTISAPGYGSRNLRVKVWNEAEQVKPLGNHSFALTLSADKIV
jgi:hypothetical protein